MKKITKIFLMIILISIVLICNVKTYSMEINNDVVEDNNIENNTNNQETENNNPDEPTVEMPTEPEEPKTEPEVSPPEVIEPEEPKIEPTEPEVSPPEVTEPEEPKAEPTEPEVSEPEQPTPPTEQVPENPQTPNEPTIPLEPQEPTVPETPDNNIPQEPEQNTQSNEYYPVYEPVKSSNNNLSKIEIVGMEIEPEFSKEITEYYLIIDLTVEELEIIATSEDYKATVDIYNVEELVEGENIIKIIVTAEDGKQKQYTIFVTKTDNEMAANANLKSLKIKGFEIYPTFKNKIYKYNVAINEKISSLEIEAEAENENATIEVSGNNNLQEGNNIITITVTAEDGVTKREYKINTFISIFNIEVKEENKIPAIIAIIAGLVIILVLGIYIISKKHKNFV